MKFKPHNSYYDLYFTDKKIMIIVPHQDDELFLCGTIIGCLTRVGATIRVVFSTNGDYGNSFERRYREACKALSHYNIKESDIIFLGYGDQWNTEYGHIYNAPDDQVVESKSGMKKTYGCDFSYTEYGVHHEYTIKNYEHDLSDVIVKFMPDVIFSNDLDWHPDHRCISMLMDRVIGNIVSEYASYRPVVYKSFVYFLGWDGKLDYSTINLPSTKRPQRYLSDDKRFQFGNPYFTWDDRLRFPVDSVLLENKKNTLYKALKEYSFSKNALYFFDSCMNSDAVFWERITDNAAYLAELSVSSGYKEYLRDFIIVDSTDISAKRMMNIDKSIWYADRNDDNPCIEYRFSKGVDISKIVFYRDTKSYGILEAKLSVTIDDDKYECIIDKFDSIKEMCVEKQNVMSIIINILCGKQIGFSEIEIREHKRFPYIKVLLGDDFIYQYIVDNKCERLLLRLYLRDCVREDCVLRVINDENSDAYIDGDYIVFGKKFKRCELRALFKYNENVYDSVIFCRN